MIFEKLLTDPKDIQQKVFNSIEMGKSLLLTYFNQNCLNIYFKDNVYKKLLNTKFEIYQADLGVFLFLKYLKGRNLNRIDATNLNHHIVLELIKQKVPLTIVGGNFDVNFIRKAALNNGINFVAYHNGQFPEAEMESVIEYLKGTETKVFIVGMGVPKQEFFAERLSETLESKVIICVGNFLEFYFKTKKRAPVFVRKIGLEWMFRLISEPKRLWKRYLIGIPVFIINSFRAKFIKNFE